MGMGQQLMPGPMTTKQSLRFQVGAQINELDRVIDACAEFLMQVECALGFAGNAPTLDGKAMVEPPQCPEPVVSSVPELIQSRVCRLEGLRQRLAQLTESIG
jgi:hypothetical protein